MPVGLLVGLVLLLLLGLLPRLMFLHNVRHLLWLGELGSHLSAIPVHSGLLVPVGLLLQLGLLVQVGPR